MDKQEYKREKLIVQFMDGREFRFVTETDSIYATIWHWEEEGKNLIVYNDFERIVIPSNAIRYYYNPKNYVISHISKEIAPLIYEINDYRPHKPYET